MRNEHVNQGGDIHAHPEDHQPRLVPSGVFTRAAATGVSLPGVPGREVLVMNRSHPPIYPARPHPEDRVDWLDVLARLAGIVAMGIAALLLVVIW